MSTGTWPQLTGEQLLRVADLFAARYGVRVVDFGTLVAAAAVPGARLQGIPVYLTVDDAAAALERSLRQLAPLSARNAEFAEFAAQVYRDMRR